MLKVAYKYRNLHTWFEMLIIQIWIIDVNEIDQNNVKNLIKVFYLATKQIYGLYYPTIYLVLPNICAISDKLFQLKNNQRFKEPVSRLKNLKDIFFPIPQIYLSACLLNSTYREISASTNGWKNIFKFRYSR